MIYKYGIDFGTTNSSIALRFVGDDEAEHTFVVDLKDTFPRETLPSVVLACSNGDIYVGPDATHRYLQNNSTGNEQLYIKQIKLDLENDGASLSYYVGNRRFDGVDLIAEIFKELRKKGEKCARELEIDVSGVVMGVPVQYGDIQKNILKNALYKAGFYTSKRGADSKTEFVSEPVAVAIHYGLNLSNDKTVLVFDFGGGTLDLAIINLKNQISVDRLHPHETLAKERLTLGGEELTRLFFIRSFCRPEKYGTKFLAKKFGFNQSLSPEELWESLISCEDGIRFINEIEICKCDLSKTSKYKFSFIGKNIQLKETTFYRDDFSNAIEDKLDDISNLVDKCLDAANISDPYDIDRVILAGGSSLIPAVQNLLIDRFGSNRVSTKMDDQDTLIQSLKHKRVSENEVLTSIVRGLAAVGCRKETLFEDVVDNDYGVWDTVNDDFIPIITSGMSVKATAFDKLTGQGTYEVVKCPDKHVSSVEVQVYQRNLNGYQKLGVINIPNPGGLEYKIFMHIDRYQGTLTVTLYDCLRRRWIDEVPLDERCYTIK